MSGANNGAHNGRAQIELLTSIRENTIRKLRDAANKADVIYQSYAWEDMKANAIGLTGGVAAMLGAAATFATGGLAAPAVVTGLSFTSGGASLLGGLCSIKNAYYRGTDLENLNESISAVLREDEREISEMFEEIRDGSEREEAKKLINEILNFADGLDGDGLDGDGLDGDGLNSSSLKEMMINWIPSVTEVISDGGFPIVSGMVPAVCIRNAIARPIRKKMEEEVVNKVAKEGAKTVSTQLAKNGAETCAKTTSKLIASETTKGSRMLVDMTVKEVAEELAERTAKQVTKEVTKEGAKTVSTQLAKNGAETGAKTATKFIASKTTKGARMLVEVTVKEAGEEVAEKATKQLAMEVAESATTKIAKDVAGSATKQVAKDVAGNATKQVAKNVTKEGAKTVPTQLAKNGAETGAKTASRAAGAAAMALGGITTAWEGYNMYQNHCATTEESQHGRELRRLANILEISLKTGKIPY